MAVLPEVKRMLGTRQQVGADGLEGTYFVAELDESTGTATLERTVDTRIVRVKVPFGALRSAKPSG
jgi:hypothetical protein